MNKLWLFIIGAVIVVAGVWYLGLYTYFIKTEIHEELPMSDGRSDSGESRMKFIAAGEFGEIDLIHKGSGRAKLIEINGTTILRFEGFNVTSGPDLYVYLSDSPKPTHDIKDLGNYIELGRLKATSGDQNYDVPVSAKNYRTAIIWCKQFGVLFSFAVMDDWKTEGIDVSSPKKDSVIQNPLMITGEARGPWYFEAQFTAELFDAGGKFLGRSILTAKSEWMTENFVPFDGKLEFENPNSSSGVLRFLSSNPSGLAEHQKIFDVPIKF